MATFAPAALCGRRTPSPRAALDRVVAPASTSYGGVGPARGARAVARVAPTRLERWWSPRRPPRRRARARRPRRRAPPTPPPPRPPPATAPRAGGGFGAGPPPPRRPPRDDPPTNEELPVRVTVECAMPPRSRVCSSTSPRSSARVDAYFGALFPMPVVIAAGPRTGTGRAARRDSHRDAPLSSSPGCPLRSSNLSSCTRRRRRLGVAWNARCTPSSTSPFVGADARVSASSPPSALSAPDLAGERHAAPREPLTTVGPDRGEHRGDVHAAGGRGLSRIFFISPLFARAAGSGARPRRARRRAPRHRRRPGARTPRRAPRRCSAFGYGPQSR